MKTIDVEFPRCVELTGIKRQPFATPLTTLVDGMGVQVADVKQFASWIAFFRINKDYPFLTLARGEGTDTRVLSRGNTALTAAMKYWGDDVEESNRAKSDSWFALTETDARSDEKKKVSIVVEVNTRHKKFRDLCSSAGGKPLEVLVLVSLVGRASSGDAKKTVDGVFLKVTIPVGQIAAYDGILGIDFGNTNTTMVALGLVSGDQPQVVPCEQFMVEQDVDRGRARKEARPVPTVLEIIGRAVDTGGVSRCELSYGSRAAQASKPTRVLMGAKRMLSDLPDDVKDKTIRVPVGEGVEALPAHEPAELFIAKMLEAFMWYTEKRPDRIAITCPSTFSATEVERLKATVINARSRALQDSPRLNPSAVENGRFDAGAMKCVKTCLDEATAATFFFANREAIELPGGLDAFNYIHPNGMNILVYDCGGGTTDITLAKVDVIGGSTLDVKVLGRVGHRTFGGDFITRQYFRVLKALVCWNHVERDLAETSEGYAAVFDRLERSDQLERFCPTRYDRNGLRTEDVARRQDITWAMWRLAEQLKCAGVWCGSEQGAFDTESVDKAARDQWVRDFLEFQLGNGSTIRKALGLEEDFKERLDHPDASRWIEDLIDADLDATVKCANDLIESKLSDAVPDGESAALCDVHAVYLVGNASRFPLIRRRIVDSERGLRVRFLAERVRDIGSGLAAEDLKGCVAKGAAIATRCNEVGVNVVWDKQLMNKLPYDVVYDERAAGASLSMLFEQGANRDDLQPAGVQIIGSLGSRLFIKRRWPGEGHGEPYVSFAFEQTMEPGTYMVAYDPKRRRYKAYHRDRETAVTWGAPETSPPFVSPVQSGDL